MSQNTSTAVMQRRIEPHDSLEYFPTQPWATRAACEFLSAELGEDLSWQTVWEPACGEMFMADPLDEYFASVIATDIHRYSARHGICDFLFETEQAPFARPDWIFTNPPFKLAQRFIELATRRARRGVAMFLRSAFTEGGERLETLFTPETRPSYVVTYSERVVLLKGRMIRANAPDPFNLDEKTGEPKLASSATSYSLLIWQPGQHDTRHRWIPKCRTRLERDADYPTYEEQWAIAHALKAELARQLGQEALL